MRLSPIHRSAGILAICCGLAWPQASAAARDSSAAGPSAAADRALPKDAFMEFLRESRFHEDSLHYQQGELASAREEFDLALSHHLAAELPADGKFRNDLLAQRSRIFARLWPSANSTVPGGKGDLAKEAIPQKPAFDWGVGAEHSRWMDRTGPQLPYGTEGIGEESRNWKYRTYASQCWPVYIGEKALNLGLSANANRSDLGEASSYEAGLEADIPEGMMEDAFLSFSAGLGKERDSGSHRYYGMQASRTWHFEEADAGFEAGYSGQWDGGWKRLSDNAWAKASRGFSLQSGNSCHASLEVAAIRQDSRADAYTVTITPFNDAAGGKILSFQAPQSFISFSPSLTYSFSVPAGLQAQAGAWYGFDIYPDYAWDRIPGADNGTYREYVGTEPLERVKTRRLDNRLGLDFDIWKELPHGYYMSVEPSIDLRWTNLARTAPATYRPWQWGMAFNLSRSLTR